MSMSKIIVIDSPATSAFVRCSADRSCYCKTYRLDVISSASHYSGIVRKRTCDVSVTTQNFSRRSTSFVIAVYLGDEMIAGCLSLRVFWFLSMLNILEAYLIYKLVRLLLN